MTTEHLPSPHKVSRVLAPVQVQRVVKMLKDGYPAMLICERFSITREQLRTIREKNNIAHGRVVGRGG